MRKILFLLSGLFILNACSDDVKTENTQPRAQQDERKESRGKLTGEEGLSMGGAGHKKAEDSASPLGVNSYLWRATLDTLAFMPLASADPFGGVIITDWYEDPKTPGERFKVNAIILDKTLRADGIKITVFKQSMVGKGNWRDQLVDDKLGRSLEDTILTRARQMKIQSGGK